MTGRDACPTRMIVMVILLSIVMIWQCEVEPVGAVTRFGPGSVQDYAQWSHLAIVDTFTSQTIGSKRDTLLHVYIYPWPITSSDSAFDPGGRGLVIDSLALDHLVGPNTFRLALETTCYGSGDTAYFDSLWFHGYDELGNGPIVNASGGSSFLRSQGSLHPLYPYWVYDSDECAIDSVYQLYNLQISRGYMELYVIGQAVSTLTDTFNVSGSLWQGRR